MAPLLQLSGLSAMLTEGLAGLARVQALLSEPREDASPRRTCKLINIEGCVVFDNVSFAYHNGETILNQVSFEARPGTATAFVGPSGAGKSTIIGLIAAFQEPTEGVIRADGVDLSTVRLSSYRTRLGVVLQDNFLFDGTIRDKVAFARSDASEADILEACRIARVDEFATRFPDGYGTVVGERGVKLSMGQWQRIGIARAVLADPRILILDEATSSLDSESEAAIQDSLAYLMRGRTTFFVAHRMSTIRSVNQIVVLQNGCVVERGIHEELSARRGRYFELLTAPGGTHLMMSTARA
jgi:ABC-type multidrug transport system fused ATPase/permease subunit